MNALKETLPGIIVVLVVAIISLLISSLHPSFEALFIAIILGMFVANVTGEKDLLSKGAALAIKVFLPIGIALYGAQLSFSAADLRLLPCVLAVFLSLFILTFLISKGFGLTRNTGTLLSAGISVCGASAIAIISPLIGAKKEETAVSVIAVMLTGLAGMIFYPLLTDILLLEKDEFAFLSGTTLPMLGQVKAVGFSGGADILAAALKLKLIRIFFLIFLPSLILIFSNGGTGKRLYVPWFLAVFIALAIVVNTIKEARFISGAAEPFSRFSLSAALAAIGLSVDFESVVEKGLKPFFAVAISWGIVVLLMYLVFSIRNV